MSYFNDVRNPSYAALITQIQTFSQSPLYRAAAKSWAYYRNVAYSAKYGIGYDSPFFDWDETQQGKRPFVVPIGKVIIDSGAEFLFSDPPKFQVPSNAELEDFISDICDANGLEAKLLPLARACANEGGLWLKFAWTPEQKKRPVAISALSPYQVTAFRDPMDADVIQSIRVQFKYEEGDDWWLYREEWDADEVRYFKRLRTQPDDDTLALQGFVRGEWPVERTEVNRFGLLPFVQIYNRRLAAEQDGVGDLWDIYDLLNSLATTYWLQNRSNQWDGDPLTVIQGEEIRSFPDQVLPGSILRVVGKNVDFKRLNPENDLRDAMRQYAQDVERMALDACGADRLNPGEITNMGKMTRQVMELVFKRSVSTALEKRTNWGKCGFELFFEALLEGLSRLPDAVQKFPVLRQVSEADPASYNVVTKWPSIFQFSSEERTAMLNDLVTAVQNGMLTRERAIETAAELFGVDDLQTLKDELADWEPPMPEAPAESTNGQRNAALRA